MTTGSKSYTTPDDNNYGTISRRSWVKSWNGSDDRLNKKAFNPYTMTFSDQIERASKHQYLLNPYNYGYRFSIGSRQLTSSLYTSNDELTLLSRLSETMRGHSFNAAIAAAESLEALSTVRNSLQAMNHVVGAIVHRDIPALLRSVAALPGGIKSDRVARKLKVGDVPGAFLSIRYGWIPLLQDIYAAMEAFAALIEKQRYVSYDVSFGRTVPARDIGNAVNNWHSMLTEDRVRARLKAYVSETQHPSIPRSLGLYNPAAVIWEKTPWSFIFDWVVPIGTYLDTLGYLWGVNGKYEKSVYAYRVDTGFGYGSNIFTFWKYAGPPKGDYVGTYGSLTRTVTTSLSIPLPSVKSVEKIFSTGHIANATALVSQQLINLANSRNKIKAGTSFTESENLNRLLSASSFLNKKIG